MKSLLLPFHKILIRAGATFFLICITRRANPTKLWKVQYLYTMLP